MGVNEGAWEHGSGDRAGMGTGRDPYEHRMGTGMDLRSVARWERGRRERERG